MQAALWLPGGRIYCVEQAGVPYIRFGVRPIRHLPYQALSGGHPEPTNLLNTADSPLPPAIDPVLFWQTGVQGGG